MALQQIHFNLGSVGQSVSTGTLQSGSYDRSSQKSSEAIFWTDSWIAVSSLTRVTKTKGIQAYIKQSCNVLSLCCRLLTNIPRDRSYCTVVLASPTLCLRGSSTACYASLFGSENRVFLQRSLSCKLCNVYLYDWILTTFFESVSITQSSCALQICILCVQPLAAVVSVWRLWHLPILHHWRTRNSGFILSNTMNWSISKKSAAQGNNYLFGYCPMLLRLGSKLLP